MSGHHKWADIKRKFKTRKHRLPLGTSISFEENPAVYETAGYQGILECKPGCEADHDHFEEPHICVSKTIHYSMPLSQLKTIFDDDGFGREPTDEERGIDE
jgi:hypothetical protein